MKALVTGGAGFIGSHLVDALLKLGHEVIVLDNFSTGRSENLAHIESAILTVITCDLSQNQDWHVHFIGVDWVFHLAALADIVPSIERPGDYFHANVDGTFNVLQACRSADIKRIIYAASSSCYGIPDDFPTSELAESRLQYPYALTKYLGEKLVLHWSQLYNLPAISLRFFNVFGPRSRTSGTYGAVFGVFLAQKLANKPFTVVGNGNQTRDFTYVSDIVNSLIIAAKSDVTGEMINIGSDGTYSINKLVDLLGGEVQYIPHRPGEPDCTWANTTKAKQLLNWKAQVSFEEGVNNMLSHIDYWQEAPVWGPDSIEKATAGWFKYLSKESS